MICARCNNKTAILIDTPTGSPWKKVCKDCVRFLWAQFDREVGLDDPAGETKKVASRRRYKPTQRHKRIAQIACSLGVNVNEDDVKKIFDAAKIEYEQRTGKPAGGKKKGFVKDRYQETGTQKILPFDTGKTHQ